MPGYKILIAMMLVGLVCFIPGCGESDGVVSSVMPSGRGYKIVLAAKPDTISSGGQAVLLANIFDPQGNLVADEEAAVVFSCAEAGATVEATPGIEGFSDIKDGAAHAILKWKDESSSEVPLPSKLATITAVYRGAMASVQVILVSKSY